MEMSISPLTRAVSALFSLLSALYTHPLPFPFLSLLYVQHQQPSLHVTISLSLVVFLPSSFFLIIEFYSALILSA